MKIKLNVSEAISHWAKYLPLKICVRSEKISLSFQQLNSVINYIAENCFIPNSNGNNITLLIENKLLLLVMIIAVTRSGKSVAVLNPNLNSDEVKFAVTGLETKQIYCEDKFINKVPRYITSTIVDCEVISKNINYTSHRNWDSPKIDSNWGTLYSSGTTGNPKGMFRSHFSILSELLGWCLELEIKRSTHCFIARPIFYTGGLVLSLATLLIGGNISLFENFSEDIFYNFAQKEQISIAFLVPSQIKSLIKFIRCNKITNPHIAETIFSMGAAFPEKLKSEAKYYLKSNIIESWGNTEGLGTITSPEDLTYRPSSIGRPFLTDELMIVDEKGNPQNKKVIGRIAGKVDSRFSAYIDNEELNKKLIKGDLIISEDLGMEDENGYFYLYGRLSDIVNTKRGIIYPIIIEKIISSIENVDEVAVLGLPQERYEKLVCVIKFIDKPTNLKIFLNKINSILNKKQSIEEIKVINEFPKTASGKIKKEALKYLFK